MPLHITKTNDGEHAMCICHNPIGVETTDGDTELGILLPCGHMFGDLCLRKMKEVRGTILCALCRASVPSNAARVSSETRAGLEQEIMPMPTPLDSIGNQLYLLSPFDNAPRTEPLRASSQNAEVLRMPIWLAEDDLQRFLNGLTVANFRSVANMRHTTVYPSAQLAAIMALYTAQEVEEIGQAVRDAAPISGPTTVAALTSDPGGSNDNLMEDAIDEGPPLSPEVVAKIREILFRPLYRHYNTRLDAFVRADDQDVIVEYDAPPPKPIRSGAWLSLSSYP